jgi:hypothetical protein
VLLGTDVLSQRILEIQPKLIPIIKAYTVNNNTCTCLDHQTRHRPCKHILAVAELENIGDGPDGESGSEEEPAGPDGEDESEPEEEPETEMIDLIQRAAACPRLLELIGQRTVAFLNNYSNNIPDLIDTPLPDRRRLAALCTAADRQRRLGMGWQYERLNAIIRPKDITNECLREWYALLWGGDELVTAVGKFTTVRQLQAQANRALTPPGATKADMCVAVVRTAAQRATNKNEVGIDYLTKILTVASSREITLTAEDQWARACRNN